MSASAIIDGFINSLTAASVIGACSVDKDYAILDRVSGCGVVVSWTGFRASETAFGGQWDLSTTFRLEVYSKNTGNPHATQRRTITLLDKIAQGLRDDPDIQGTVEQIDEIRASRTPGEVLRNQSGINFLPIDVEVDVTEYDYD